MKILIFFLFVSNVAFSQKNLVLSKQIRIPYSVKYRFSNVVDSREIKRNIGSYFDEFDQKKQFFIQPSLQTALKKIIVPALSTDSASSQIIYDIKRFEFNEKIKSQNLINGTFNIQVAFLKIVNTDTLSLVEYSNKIQYTRSITKKNDEYFAKIIENQLNYSFTYFNVWFYKNQNIHEAFIEKTEIKILPDEKKDDSDTLIYGTRELNWEDFKGKPKFITLYAGAIFASITYTAHFGLIENILQANVSANAYMVKGMSWIRPDNKTDQAFAHEKLHFAIAKVIIEKFKKEISGLQAFSVDDLQSLIQLQYIESYREMNRMQDLYDSETNHGLNLEKQKEWQEKIVRMLQ